MATSTFWDYQEYSATLTGEGQDSARNLQPLVLNNEWADRNSETSFYGDFQSNHADASSSLAGLGIHNLGHTVCKDDENPWNDCVPFGTTNPAQLQGLPHYNSAGTPYDYSLLLGDHKDQHPPSISPWPFPLETEVNKTIPDAEPNVAFSESSRSDESLSQTSSDSSTDFALIFEQLSASTGLSVTDFAEQLSATAEVTLKRMAEEGLGSQTSVDSQGSTGLSTSKWQSPRLFLPRSSAWTEDCVGVNPADILPPDSPLPAHTEPLQFLPPPSAFDFQAAVPAPHIPSFEGYRNPQPNYHLFKKEEETIPLFRSSVMTAFLPPARPSQHASDDELSAFESPSSSEYSPDFSVGQKRHHHPRAIRHRIPTSVTPDEPGSQSPEPPEVDPANLPPLNLGTPVLDAHRGVDIEMLKAKAERYRLRNQGREYDKRWLIAFAGKLSARGELMDEFRCYIAGCKQMNKRRDHILIHVGAHLDQRPFKCMYCPSRFLRKNECKRHELSHTGLRPFSCHLCPYPSTTFVRQDLLKRHMKRTHRLDLKADKENHGTTYRPRKRTKI